jgi:hypothetical protein
MNAGKSPRALFPVKPMTYRGDRIRLHAALGSPGRAAATPRAR